MKMTKKSHPKNNLFISYLDPSNKYCVCHYRNINSNTIAVFKIKLKSNSELIFGKKWEN